MRHDAEQDAFFLDDDLGWMDRGSWQPEQEERKQERPQRTERGPPPQQLSPWPAASGLSAGWAAAQGGEGSQQRWSNYGSDRPATVEPRGRSPGYTPGVDGLMVTLSRSAPIATPSGFTARAEPTSLAESLGAIIASQAQQYGSQAYAYAGPPTMPHWQPQDTPSSSSSMAVWPPEVASVPSSWPSVFASTAQHLQAAPSTSFPVQYDQRPLYESSNEESPMQGSSASPYMFDTTSLPPTSSTSASSRAGSEDRTGAYMAGYSLTNPNPSSDRKLFPFVEKLYFLLQHPELFGDCIRFDLTGKTFIICHGNTRLVDEVLPRVFAHRRISSLTRQLNIYNFRRISQSELEERIDQSNPASLPLAQYSGWTHAFFCDRVTFEELLTMKPKPVKPRAKSGSEGASSDRQVAD